MMQTTEFLRSTLALAAGGALGVSFGFVQNLALRRNEKAQQATGTVSSAAGTMGSMRRVAYLLLLLVLIQIVCPLLFVNGSQWWVSAGVVFGYGASLFSRLRHRNQTVR
jgi:hypothetical protein